MVRTHHQHPDGHDDDGEQQLLAADVRRHRLEEVLDDQCEDGADDDRHDIGSDQPSPQTLRTHPSRCLDGRRGAVRLDARVQRYVDLGQARPQGDLQRSFAPPAVRSVGTRSSRCRDTRSMFMSAHPSTFDLHRPPSTRLRHDHPMWRKKSSELAHVFLNAGGRRTRGPCFHGIRKQSSAAHPRRRGEPSRQVFGKESPA